MKIEDRIIQILDNIDGLTLEIFDIFEPNEITIQATTKLMEARMWLANGVDIISYSDNYKSKSKPN